MPMINSKLKNSRHKHCFSCLFRRKKTSSIDSYQYTMDFPRLSITLPPFVPMLMSYRWNDENDCEPLAKKSTHNNNNNNNTNHHRQHIRRRIPKRYSNIIGSFTRKNFSLEKDSINREKQTILPLFQSNHFSTTKTKNSRHHHHHHSLKSINEKIYCFNKNKKKSHEIKDHYSNHTIKHNNILAQRMQAAMSSELMNSLDRNFVFGYNKQSTTNSIITRSHSFDICTSYNDKSDEISYHNFKSKIKNNFNKEDISIHVPTPDYDEQNDDIIIQTLNIENNINEEPIIDYDDSKSIIKYELDDESNHEILSSFIIQQISINNNEEQIPTPPPLPNLDNKQKKITFHCRTIADKLSSDHKLILKDDDDDDDDDDGVDSLKISYHNLSKDLILNKNSQSLSYTYSPDESISQLINHETNLKILCQNPSITDEQIQHCLSSSSVGTSIDIDYDDEHRSSSSKLYNDYKKQTSLISIPTSTIHSHSIIIQPMHTHFGLRSSTSSTSTNEKLTDMTLPSKQMNVCVINQLNEHLSTRVRKQQQDLCSNNFNNSDNNNYQSYDSSQEHMSENNNNNNIQLNIYNESKDVPVTNSIYSSSIPPPPPPPPPLPVDGFHSIIPTINRSTNNYQRTSIMTLPREINNSTIPCSTGTSTISSNLSDTRILRELRENPLFTRAKQQLEIEPGSNGRRSGRRLIGSTLNITNTETVSYIQLDNYTKTNLKKSYETTTNPQQLETIIMLPNELNSILGKRTKSTNDINQIKSRPCTKSLIQTQCRQSELELIFQKRAQRSEQNLM
ncbi:unnamed protein product [Rotaria sordida]|uniref:Uncharacterized protein n=2 Tax=Rotaria sordida TaxID=392033 RepID=A0A814DL96_9BILA|nr:unnamed protein product [Rotaria sordida]